MALEELELFESKPAVLKLSAGEVDALLLIGRELASTTSWWGGSVAENTRSVIFADQLRDGSFRLTFKDVIGVVCVGNKQIHVRPKIPMNHFSYIAGHSDVAPRLGSSASQLKDGHDLISLIARWCVDAGEKLLRQGFRKDYTDSTDEVDQVMGSILPLQTYMLTSVGVPRAVCTFQEFTDDTMLNRVVKAACLKVARTSVIDPMVRSRARQVAYRMDKVGDLQPDDLRVKIDRLSANYSRLLSLSRLVLAGLGLTVAAGRHIGTSFLIRTPELIEDGLRSLLQVNLQDIKVAKRRLMLGNSGLSINPDLVFGTTLGIADVKYRLIDKDWSKSDLNQVVTFATGFRTNLAAVLAFSSGSTALPRPVSVGDIGVKAFAWNSNEHINPEASAKALTDEIRGWLSSAKV